jgi:hypothetical protein
VYSHVYVVKLDDFYFTADLLLQELPFHLQVTFDLPQFTRELVDISCGRVGTHEMLRDTEIFEHLVGSDMFELDAFEFIYRLVGALEAFLLKGYRLRLFYTQHHISFPNNNVIFVREIDNAQLGMAR